MECISTPENLIDAVAEQYNLKTKDLCSVKRRRELVFPRTAATYLLRKHFLLSFPEIARHFQSHHSVALNLVNRAIEELKVNADFRARVEEIESRIAPSGTGTNESPKLKISSSKGEMIELVLRIPRGASLTISNSACVVTN